MEGERAPTEVGCLNCGNFTGCVHLAKGRRGVLDKDKIITPESDVYCADFAQAHSQELAMRRELLDAIGGVGADALYASDHKPITDLRIVMNEEEDTLEVPDFLGMLYGEDGEPLYLTIEEREEQLRYETEDDGSLKLGTDERKIPRSQLVLKKYVLSEEFAQVAKNVVHKENVWCWNTDDLVNVILREELDAELLVRKASKEKSTMPIPKAKAGASSGAPKRVNVTAGAKPKPTAPASSGKAAPAAKAAAKKATAKPKASAPKEDPGEAPAEAGSEAFEAMAAELEKLKTEMGEMKELLEAVQEGQTKGLTILHNVLQKTVLMAQKDTSNALAFVYAKLTDDEEELENFKLVSTYTAPVHGRDPIDYDEAEDGEIALDDRELDISEGESIFGYLEDGEGNEE